MTVLSAPLELRREGAYTPGRLARAGLAAVIVLGPLSIAVVRSILPYHTTDSAAAITAEVAAHPGAQSAQLWVTLIATMTLVPAIIAVGLAAAAGSRRLGIAGMSIAVAGTTLLTVTTAMDFAVLAGIRSGIGVDATTKLVDSLNAMGPQVVATAIFVVGHILGIVLLGVALLRGRVIAAWAAWALIVSQPLHFVFAVIVPNRALDAAAWTLTTIAFAAVAATIVRTSRTAS